MKKLIFVMGFLMMLMITPMAMADTITTVGGYGPYQTGQGGEFTVLPDASLSYLLSGYSNLTRDFVQAGTFQTFCLEDDEYIYSNTKHYVVLNDKAIWGSVGPQGDPLSVGAAYLYHQFQIEALPYNYTNVPAGGRKTSADLLQKAIWWLEGEENQVYNPANPYELLVVTQFGSAAGAMADNKGLYPVMVMNLYLDSALTQRAQDLLVCAPVPEPATMLLFGTGLIGLAGLGRKKLSKKVSRTGFQN